MTASRLFSIGEVVVYPSRGVGTIQDIELQEVSNATYQVYVIYFDQERLTVRLPVARAESAGLRCLMQEDVFEKALDVLRMRPVVKKIIWSKRVQELEGKINSGDPLLIAEVLRDLYRAHEGGDQSFSERQMFQHGLQRLAREWALVENVESAEIIMRIESVLSHKKMAA